jgi:hypothetical protein
VHFAKRFHRRSKIPQFIVAPRWGMRGLPDERGTKRQLSRFLCDRRIPIPRMFRWSDIQGRRSLKRAALFFLVARSSEVRVACAISIVGCDLQHAYGEGRFLAHCDPAVCALHSRPLFRFFAPNIRERSRNLASTAAFFLELRQTNTVV